MNSTRCAKCGLVNFTTAAECKRCKSPLVAGEPAAQWSHTFGGGASAPSSQGHTATAADGGLYYKPSGEVTVAALAAGLLGGLLVGLVLAFVYAYLLVYVPFVYAHFLCTLGYVLALGAVVGCLLKAGKMRNNAVGVFTAAAVSLASYYFCWAVWLAAVLARADVEVSTLALAAHPSTLFDMIVRLNEVGAWSVGRSKGVPVTGFMLWVVWGVEALAALAGPPAMAWAALSSEPFCEHCDEWCVEDMGLVSLSESGQKEELRRHLESKQFDRLKAFGAKRDDAARWYRLDLYRCKNCDRTNTLTVKSENLQTNSKGNTKVNSSAFISHLLLTAAEVEELRRVSREIMRPTAAPAPAEAAASAEPVVAHA